MTNTTRLYHHRTDGGAEYLCLRPVPGTTEGDLHTAIIRLDGDPELLNPDLNLQASLKNLEKIIEEVRNDLAKLDYEIRTLK